jgi:hypothetical protein
MAVGLPKGAVTVTGALKGYAKTGESGQAIERLFCPECGSSIMDEAAAMPGVLMIAGGTLEDHSWVKPATQIYCASAQPWVELGGGIQRFDRAPG